MSCTTQARVGSDPAGPPGAAAGTTSSPGTGTPNTSTQNPPGAVAELALPGPNAVDVLEDGVTNSNCGGTAVDVYRPIGVEPAGHVVYAAGQAVPEAGARALGEHLASWGFEVVVPYYCWFPDAITGVDDYAGILVDISDHYRPGAPWVYLGDRDGAPSAAHAAVIDLLAPGWVALNPSDERGIGETWSIVTEIEGLALVGTPDACNDQGSGAGMVRDHLAYQVVGAGGCDFWLGDPSCTCPGGTGDPQRIGDAIRALTTAAVMWHTGDPRGEAYWTPGNPQHDQFTDVLAPGP